MNNKTNDENWVEKCMTCQHCYKRRDDEYLYCRKRNGKCEYKAVQEQEKGGKNR